MHKLTCLLLHTALLLFSGRAMAQAEQGGPELPPPLPEAEDLPQKDTGPSSVSAPAGQVRGFPPDPVAAEKKSGAVVPEVAPGLGISVGPLDFALHGYIRAPLRLGFRGRDEGGFNIRSPLLVDDDYLQSGFAYTRIQETAWAELYLTVSNKHLVGEVALLGSLFSDSATVKFPDDQKGIAQGSLMYRWQSDGPRLRFRLNVKAGAFWDRFGWLENYDTYMFGRTHQIGGQVRMEFEGQKWTFWLLQGLGAHLADVAANQGLTLLNYLYAGLRYQRSFEAGFYYLDARTQDKEQLKDRNDASMQVIGLDTRVNTSMIGHLYLAGSAILASQAKYLSPAIEVIHAYGGNSLTEYYLGNKSDNGTGSVWSAALEHRFSVRELLSARASEGLRVLHGGDFSMRWFGMMTYTVSKDVNVDPALNHDGRTYFKWGAEAAWQVLSWLGCSLRYDRVILDVKDEGDRNSFRIISPRVTVTSHYLLGAQIFLQYSRYFYGDRINLRPGQGTLETVPDADVFKLQAQLVF